MSKIKINIKTNKKGSKKNKRTIYQSKKPTKKPSKKPSQKISKKNGKKPTKKIKKTKAITLHYCPTGISKFINTLLPSKNKTKNSGKINRKDKSVRKPLLGKSLDLNMIIEEAADQVLDNHYKDILEISQIYQHTFQGITITKKNKIPISDTLKKTFPNKLKILELVGDIMPKIDVRFKKIQDILKMSKTLQNKELTNFFDKENRFISEVIYNLRSNDISEIQKTYPLFNPIEDPLLYSEFVSLDVQNCILENIKYKYEIEFRYNSYMKNNNNNQYGEINLDSTFEFYVGKKDIFTNEFNIKLIIARLIFFNQYLNVGRTPKFRIFFCPNEKEMPTQYTNNLGIFAPNNVNTAVTNGIDIIIWRQEELLKSIVHECIHYHKLDFHFNDYPGNLVKEFRNYNITSESELRISEAYCEVMANLLNIIFTSTSMHLKSNTLWTIPKNEFKKHFIHEIKFSCFNASKVLHFLKCQQWSDFKEKKNKYSLHQTTSVFSYYIIKSIFLFNLHQLLSNNKNSKNKAIIKFNGDFKKLHQIATNNLYLTNWEQIVNHMITQLNDKMEKNNKLSKHPSIKSLRMTSIETLIPC